MLSAMEGSALVHLDRFVSTQGPLCLTPSILSDPIVH